MGRFWETGSGSVYNGVRCGDVMILWDDGREKYRWCGFLGYGTIIGFKGISRNRNFLVIICSNA